MEDLLASSSSAACSSSAGADQARSRVMLESLQTSDPEIDQIISYSSFVVTYVLQWQGPNAGWRKANIEGPVYVVRRRLAPRYQILVKNQYSQHDLLDDLHPGWELDRRQNYIFYKVKDPSKRIRGLWFNDDLDRVRVHEHLERLLLELRNETPEASIQALPELERPPTPSIPAPPLPLPREEGRSVERASPLASPPPPPPPFHSANPRLAAQPPGVDLQEQAAAVDLHGQPPPVEPPEVALSVSLDIRTLRNVMRSLSGDDAFLRVLQDRLADMQSQGRLNTDD